MSNPITPKKLFVIVGATAVGKTNITLKLADHYRCPVLSSDARQCYRELGIATAKPSQEELTLVPHYFINSHSIHKPVSAADYELFALKVLEKVFADHHRCLLSGGSGLYIKSLCLGLDEIPAVAQSLRSQLEHRCEKEGLEPLLMELNSLDPGYVDQMDTRNPRRVIRALEVCLGTGRPFSTFREGQAAVRPFQIIKVGLQRDRKELYRRIDQRMDEMISSGLFQEAATLYPLKHLRPLQTVGYQEIFGYLDGQYAKDEAIRLLKRNSRRYAKRQMTWFGKDEQINWFHADDYKSILSYLDKAGMDPG